MIYTFRLLCIAALIIAVITLTVGGIIGIWQEDSTSLGGKLALTGLVFTGISFLLSFAFVLDPRDWRD